MPVDVLLITEEELPSRENYLFDMMEALGANRTRPWQFLPHDIHLGVSLLATVCRREGLECEVADNFFRLPGPSARLDALLERRPMAVGLSTTLLLSDDMVGRAVERVRRISPGSKVILGGPSVLQFPALRRHADITVLYDGEGTLPALLRTLKDGKDLSGVPGIEFEAGGRRIVTAPPATVPLDRLPRPDWASFGRGSGLVYPIETQRGCPYACRYCTHPVYNPSAGLRLRPIDQVVEELRANYEEHGITLYRFVDSTFTYPVERAVSLCEAIRACGLPLRWSCYGRADNMDDRLAGAMAGAGCRSVLFGIETGDDDLMKRMNKGYGLREVYSGAQAAQAAGIACVGSFIVGYPGETERSAANTEACLKDLGLSLVSLGTFWLDPNSPVWRDRESLGLSGSGNHWRHKTMDSEQARTLLRGMLNRLLLQNKVRLGLDFYAATLVNMGLDFDEALRYMQAKSILIGYRMACAQRAPLGSFPPAEIESTERFHSEMLLKMAGASRRLWN